MRVLHVISNMSQGGAQKLLFEIMSHEESKEYSLFILNSKNNIYLDKLHHYGIKVYSVSRYYFSLKNIILFRSIIHKFDCIHTHLFHAQYFLSFFFLIFKKPYRLKLFTTEHSTTNRRRKKYLKPLEKFVYSKYNLIIAISQSVKKTLIDWLENDIKIEVIPNGIKIKYSYNNYLKNTKSLYPKKVVNLLMVARFSPSKNHRMLINCMERLPNNYYLTLLGDGELFQREKNYAKSRNLLSRINFVGYCNVIDNYYANTDIYIQMSNWEGFGLATVEAMSFGLPVIASDVDGLNEIVSDCGILVPNNDLAQLCNEIIEISNNPNRTKELSICSYKKSKKYNINEMISKYNKIYDK